VLGILEHAQIQPFAGSKALWFWTAVPNMRSVWICSRNDAIGNVAVVLAAAGVSGTGTAWADLIVAGIMAVLGLWGGQQIMSQALPELKMAPHLARIVILIGYTGPDSC
jgi:hypothetical protein